VAVAVCVAALVGAPIGGVFAAGAWHCSGSWLRWRCGNGMQACVYSTDAQPHAYGSPVELSKCRRICNFHSQTGITSAGLALVAAASGGVVRRRKRLLAFISLRKTKPRQFLARKPRSRQRRAKVLPHSRALGQGHSTHPIPPHVPLRCCLWTHNLALSFFAKICLLWLH
jgi:hypothetical protein